MLVQASADPLLSTSDVARWIGVSPRTVCLWAEVGELPGMKVGKQWRFEKSAIQVWLQVKAASGCSVRSGGKACR